MKNNIPTIFKDERVPLVVADNKKIQLRITTVALTFSFVNENSLKTID